MEVIKNIHTLLMLLAYVMRRAGTFSMEEKVKMIEFLGYMAANPYARIAGPGGEETPLGLFNILFEDRFQNIQLNDESHRRVHRGDVPPELPVLVHRPE